MHYLISGSFSFSLFIFKFYWHDLVVTRVTLGVVGYGERKSQTSKKFTWLLLVCENSGNYSKRFIVFVTERLVYNIGEE